jgi:ubiquinone/menaquinone biosynthesis C-methylase UbiE
VAINTIRGDVRKLPFNKGSFDAALAYHSIYHVDSKGLFSALEELYRVLRPKAELFLTFNSKSNPTYSDPGNLIIDENVRMKKEEDGSVLPHYYCDLNSVYQLMSKFKIITLRQIEDIYGGGSSWHYFLLAVKMGST